MSITRRRFMGFTAGAAAGLAAGGTTGWVLSGRTAIIDRLTAPPGGPERHRLSICRMCPGGCGVRVRCIGGRPVKVDGNPLHPISGGRLCAKGQAALQLLNHPDRILTPMRRDGPRGTLDSFRPATWQEALDEIAVRLSLLRRQGRPEALALVRGPSRGVDARVGRRFLQAFGSPNDVALDRGDEAAAQALELTQGVRAVPAYDLQSAEFVLSFGGALLEASGSPVHTMRAYGEFRQGRAARRGKLVHIAPRLSITGAQADEWVPVRPGTEGMLAMGLARVLVAEELYDKDFVIRHTAQFEDFEDEGVLREGLRTLLERDFPLERVSLETGVSVSRLLQLARELAASEPALAIGPRAGPLLPGQLFDHLAVHVLNALTGNIDAMGGVLVPEETPLPAWPNLPIDPIAERGRSRPRLDGAGGESVPLLGSDPEALAETIRSGKPYETGALILADADPVFTSTTPHAFASALEQIPLVVSLSDLPDDTGLYADWILPLAHSFECWDLDLTPPGVPFPLASFSAPVVAARGEARSGGDFFLDLARHIGGPVGEALPWPDLESLLRMETDGLYLAQRGALVGTEFDEAWVRLMERSGWWAPGYRSPDELWSRVRETGGWWDPFYDHGDWSRVLAHETGRFEFRSAELARLARERRERLEVYEREQVARSASGSLALQLFEPLPVGGGVGAELPFLQEILDPGHEARWETWVELHPDTAKALGVEHRTSVEVSSPQGRVHAVARVTDRVVPGVAAMPVGLGKQAGGRWARGLGDNPLRLLSPVREAMSGLPELGATRVRVAALVGSVEEGRRRA